MLLLEWRRTDATWATQSPAGLTRDRWRAAGRRRAVPRAGVVRRCLCLVLSLTSWLRHRRCLVFPLLFVWAKTPPLPCGSSEVQRRMEPPARRFARRQILRGALRRAGAFVLRAPDLVRERICICICICREREGDGHAMPMRCVRCIVSWWHGVRSSRCVVGVFPGILAGSRRSGAGAGSTSSDSRDRSTRAMPLGSRPHWCAMAPNALLVCFKRERTEPSARGCCNQTKLYLDLAVAAGVFVVFDCSIDTIAKAGCDSSPTSGIDVCRACRTHCPRGTSMRHIHAAIAADGCGMPCALPAGLQC